MSLVSLFRISFSLVLFASLVAFSLPEKTAVTEQLILFRQAYDPINDQQIDELKALAEQLNLQFVDQLITDRAPIEIALTPAIVYQNYRGRSIYKGRYNNIPRIKNFIRTSRRVYQPAETLKKKDLLVKTLGRAKVGAPLKITPLTGRVPKDFDQETFLVKARTAFAEGMSHYTIDNQQAFPANGRLFYMACYPYTHKNRLYLSLELYSQFNCIEPIFQRYDQPIEASFKEEEAWQNGFREAGRLLANEILNQRLTSTIGDAFQATWPV